MNKSKSFKLRMNKSKASVARMNQFKSSEARMNCARNKLSEETDEPCDVRKLLNVVIIFLFLLCFANVAKARYFYAHAISHDNIEVRPKKPDEGKIAYVSHIFMFLIEASFKSLIVIYKGLFILCEDFSEAFDELCDGEGTVKYYVELSIVQLRTSYKGILMFCIFCGFILFFLNNIRLEIYSMRKPYRYGMVIGLLFLLCLDYLVKPRCFIYICYMFCFSIGFNVYYVIDLIKKRSLIGSGIKRLQELEDLVADKSRRIENVMAQEERNLDKRTELKQTKRIEDLVALEKKNNDERVQERNDDLIALEKKNNDERVQERIDDLMALEKKNMHNNFLQKQIEFLEEQIQSIELSLECPVCLETASSPIYQCQESHLICRNCRPRVSACPECRLPYARKPQRNRYAENDACKMEKLNEEKLDLFKTLKV